MFDRIFKNPRTSIAGAVIFVAGLVAVYLEKATLTEFGAFLGATIYLLFTKDKKDNE